MDENLKKAALIIPYFGKWPVWIDLFLHSCRKNTAFDFFIFSDCEKPAIESDNIFYFSLSFQDYCERVSKELNIRFKPESAYKLCDLKPFYGYIHKKELKSYEFWGFCDVDLVFGKLDEFIPENLNDYDVFSTHNDRISGHFCLIRNSEKWVSRCFEMDDWKIKLAENLFLGLDELDYSLLIFPEAKLIGKFYGRFMMRYMGWKAAWETYYTIFPLIHKILNFRNRRLLFKEQHTTPILAADGRLYRKESDSWLYQDGEVINLRHQTKLMYLHFMVFKKNFYSGGQYWHSDYYHVPVNFPFDDGILIDKSGFNPIK
jgi:hypothetical protein